MKNNNFLLLLLASCCCFNPALADAQSTSSAPNIASAPAAVPEALANSSKSPKQILRTGIILSAPGLSPNSMQLATNIGIAPVLEKIQSLGAKIDRLPASSERSEARLDLLEAKVKAVQIINRTNLEIDFTMAEMSAEQNVYSEILSTFTNDRDKLLAKVNAISFISNGALWAVCEGFDIPTHTKGFYANPSGVTGILAGVIPSFASLYTLKALNGKKKTSEVEPNMLAKLFDYPVTADIEYPHSVWTYLTQIPADEPKGKPRREQMIDRWISDSNIPGFTDRSSRTQLDVLTASLAQKKGLSIGSLGTRQVMLTQLSAEVMKMKRMLLELSMVSLGEKQFITMQPRPSTQSKKQSATPIASNNVLRDSGLEVFGAK